MTKKMKKILSMITALAMSASAFASLAITASAKTDVLTENFDGESVSSAWTTKTSGANMNFTIGDTDGNKYLNAANVSTGGTRTQGMTMPQTASSEYTKVTLDFNLSNHGYSADNPHGFSVMSANGAKVFQINLPNNHYNPSTVTINGTALTGVTAEKQTYLGWYTLDAVLDSVRGKVDYTVYKQGSSTAVTSGTVDMATASAGVRGLEFYANRNQCNIMIDNIEVAELVPPVVTVEASTVELGVGGSAQIATVADAVSVDVVSADEDAAFAEYADGAVTVYGGAAGKVAITITATSADGVKVVKTVDAVVGGVELADVAVKYVNSDMEEIAEGYTISDAVVDSFIAESDLTIPEKIETADYRYTNGTAEEYVVQSGENTIYVVYADKAAAVTVVDISYVADGTEVATVTVDVPAGKYVGDEFTYISNNIVEGTDDKYYAVGNDYTTDAEPTILNNASTPVNNVLRKTVTLAEDTVITYDVTESKDVCFYGEWEDILGGGSTYATGRNIASGGKMAATTSQVQFFTVEQTGNYQIVLVGGPKKRGTAVYTSADAAAAATSVDDETALITLKNSDNNDQYGIYAVKTAMLTEGDVLTIRGFATGNNSTDNLDYVLIRHIVSGDIIGPEGISILPETNTAQFTFDSGLSGDVEWTITDAEGNDIEGVTIDADGVVTVEPTVEFEDMATITASTAGGTVTGSKEIEIAAMFVDSFEIDGPTTVAVGQTYTYSTKYIKDFFGQDISKYVDVTVESYDNSIATASGNTITVVGAGDGLIGVHVGDDVQDVEIKANYFYLTGKATGNETAIDASSLVTSDNIKGYLVTTAKGGVKVSQKTVDTVPATVDTTGADSYEIAPIYYYDANGAGLGNLNGNKTPLGDNFADGFYNMTFTKTYTERVDIYVNGYMVGNNVDQDGTGRVMSDEHKVYSVNDVVVEGGTVTVSTTDIANGSNGPRGYQMTSVELVKAPSIVDRQKKVYVTGDSLVASYYGATTDLVGSSRTGWGQVLENYLTDDVEVINMANSGQYAEGILVTAFPGMLKMAQPGDYFVIESGYNDRTYSSREKMYDALVSMVDQAMEKGVKVVLVSPNASAHDYKTGLQFSSTMTDVANDMIAKYGSDVTYVDLTTLSYNFMVDTGISTKVSEDAINYAPVYNEDGTLASITVTPVAADSYVKMPHIIWNADMKPVTTSSDTVQVDATYNLSTAGGDTLHSSYVAAMKWAEIVAQGMKDAGIDFVNTTFSYEFTDTIGNTITCRVK